MGGLMVKQIPNPFPDMPISYWKNALLPYQETLNRPSLSYKNIRWIWTNTRDPHFLSRGELLAHFRIILMNGSHVLNSCY